MSDLPLISYGGSMPRDSFGQLDSLDYRTSATSHNIGPEYHQVNQQPYRLQMGANPSANQILHRNSLRSQNVELYRGGLHSSMAGQDPRTTSAGVELPHRIFNEPHVMYMYTPDVRQEIPLQAPWSPVNRRIQSPYPSHQVGFPEYGTQIQTPSEAPPRIAYASGQFTRISPGLLDNQVSAGQVTPSRRRVISDPERPRVSMIPRAADPPHLGYNPYSGDPVER